jgi:hypothetical protein
LNACPTLNSSNFKSYFENYGIKLYVYFNYHDGYLETKH